MNKILKRAGLFSGMFALVALCYPQIGNGGSIAPIFETTVIASTKNAANFTNNFNENIEPENLNENIEVDFEFNEDEEKDAAKTAVSSSAITKSTAASSAMSFKATAYALRGRTASGAGVRRGIIAADPRVLPLGTRVQISAGAWSGTYVVADTGGVIKGRIIDVWVPNNAEARKFGRRKITVTILGRAKKN